MFLLVPPLSQGQAPVDSEDAMVEVHQAGHLVHQKEKATLSNQNSNLKRWAHGGVQVLQHAPVLVAP